MNRLFDVLSRPAEYLSAYSSVLVDMIDDNAVTRDVAAATAINIAQVLDLTDEVRRSLSSQAMVDRRRIYLVPLVLKKSALAANTNVVTFGSGLTYGDGTVYGAAKTTMTSFDLPRGVAAVGYIADSVVNETAVLLPGADYVISPRIISFRQNPIDVLVARDVYDSSGAVIDSEIVLWMVDVEIWDRLAEDLFGDVVGLVDAGESGYSAVVAGLWRILVDGPSRGAVASALAAAAGVPSAIGDETVETTAPGRVVTSRAVYRGHTGAGILVSVGDKLAAGQPVFDTVVLRDLAAPQADLTGISAVTFSVLTERGTVVVGIPNAMSVVRVVRGGIEFDTGGSAEDVTAFWSAVRAREVAAGSSLASAIIAEYGAIPRSLNPLKYLCSHMFLANTVVITTRPQHFLNSPGLMAKLGAALLPLLPARTIVVQHAILSDASDTTSIENPFAGVAFFDGFGASDRGRVAAVASPATELAYADLRPMLTNYAR